MGKGGKNWVIEDLKSKIGNLRFEIDERLWGSIHVDEFVQAEEGEAGFGEGFFGLGGGGFGVGFEEGELALVEGGEALFFGGGGGTGEGDLEESRDRGRRRAIKGKC